MRETLKNLPETEAKEIGRHVIEHATDERCPLLLNHNCLLYEARPIICRTHGLPIIYTIDGERKSDCCPRNLTEAESVSGKNVIDLDKLNPLLVAVNSIYLTQSEDEIIDTRVTIAEALILKNI